MRLSEVRVGDLVVDDVGLVSGEARTARVVAVHRTRMTIEYPGGSRDRVQPWFWRKVEEA